MPAKVKREDLAWLKIRPKSLEEMEEEFERNLPAQGWNLEVQIHNRWYPVHATWDVKGVRHPGDATTFFFALECKLQAMDKTSIRGLAIWLHDLEVHDSKAIGEWLADCNMRVCRLTDEEKQAYRETQCHAAGAALNVGHTYECKGSLMIIVNTMFGSVAIERRPAVDEPERCVIEPEEDDEECGLAQLLSESIYKPASNFLPFVRVFSLPKRAFCLVDVRDLAEPSWDDGAIEKLVIPNDRQVLLRKILDSDVARLPLDIVGAKHGGLVVLASGPPGVGKTLTAECFAEYLKKPLYAVRTHELGTTPDRVEASLKELFRRATRWRALLLIDEADVFLQRRRGDLEADAVTAVFLRALDYYHGLLFLTTNRVDHIDPAFASRISLCLPYPDLDCTARGQIWHTMLNCAQLRVTGGAKRLAAVEMNGREIRNAVRLMKAVRPDGRIGQAEALAICNLRVTAQISQKT